MPHHRLLAAATAISLVVVSAAPVFAQDAERPHGPPQATPNPVPLEAPAGDGTAVRLTTELGEIVIGLFNESAPVAAENFQNLAAQGFYDGVGFHRVVPDFVVQGGDPDGTGSGGPDYRIRDELVVGTYDSGVVAMARTQEPDSQGSQFFFVLDDEASAALDPYNTYTIFGRVLEGMDVVEAIVEANPPSNQIEEPVRILSTSIEQVELPQEPASPPWRAAANALAGTLPTQVGELDTSTRRIFTSGQIQAQVAPTALEGIAAIAEEQGTDLSRLSFAIAGGEDGDSFVSILGAQLPGVPAELVLDDIAAIVIGDAGAFEISEQTIGGRDVTALSPSGAADDSAATYRVVSDDIAYYVSADPDNLEATIAALP